MIDRQTSYTAADAFPIKIFLVNGLAKDIKHGYIPPVHPSLSPTNKCNQNCQFCSYSERDREVEMPIGQVETLVTTMVDLGAMAFDLTGGGESLMHPGIDKIIQIMLDESAKISLTTNGWLLPKIESYIRKFLWIRVSVSTYTDVDKLFGIIGKIVEDSPSVGWGLSYVVTRSPDYEQFGKLVKTANYYRMTHVRVVNDLLDLEYLPPMSSFSTYLNNALIPEDLLVYQDRQKYSRGHKKCLISLLRPNIDARGDVYPCCGTQYATEVPYRNFAPPFNMGQDYKSIWNHQRYFDGTFCKKCYYGLYNQVLNMLQSKEVKDHEFV